MPSVAKLSRTALWTYERQAVWLSFDVFRRHLLPEAFVAVLGEPRLEQPNRGGVRLF